MCWKDKIKNYRSIKGYYCAIFIILIIAVLITWENLSSLEELFKKGSTYEITEIIAIITTSALVFGVLTHLRQIQS